MELIVQGQIRAGKLLWRPSGQNYAVTVVCKVSFDLLPDMSPVASVQHPVLESDVFGPRGGMLLATDLIPFKTRPEVLVIGSAHAHEGRPVPSLVARLAMHEIDKSVLVVGDRLVNRNGRSSDPTPFTRMPLVWDRASGGANTVNPVGIPFGQLPGVDSAAPNLFPADANPLKLGPIAPVNLGPIAPNWPSRIACLRQRATHWDFRSWFEQPLPADIDIAHFNAAPHDQQRSTPFGEDSIYLQHLHPRHSQLSTRLAAVTPMVTVDRGTGPEQLKLRCDTMLIDTDRSLIMLLWRAQVVLEHSAQTCKIVVIGPKSPSAAAMTTAQNGDDEATLVPTKMFKSQATTVPLPPASNEKTTGFPGVNDENDGTHTVMGFGAAQSPVLPFDPSSGARPPGFSAFSAPAPMRPEPTESDIEATMAPIGGPRAPALPFGGRVNAPQQPAAATLDPEILQNPGVSTITQEHSDLEEQTAYIAPGQVRTGAVLPFAAGTNASPAQTIARLVAENPAPPRPAHDDSDLDGQTAFIPAGQGRSGVVLPFATEMQISAIPAVPSRPNTNTPMTLGQLATTERTSERPPEPMPSGSLTNEALTNDAIANRAVAAGRDLTMGTSTRQERPPPPDQVQLILQAIWKGDRPLPQILAEHGLTELQWRAMKRNAAKGGKP